MASEFGKYWKDLKKHAKRQKYWLPHLKALAGTIGGTRKIRYFTLCARPMIDVFMLVSEGLLQIDEESHAIESVQFCEVDPEDFSEIRDMLAREDVGFQDFLEKAALFEDDDFTAACPDLDSISSRLEDEGLAEAEIDRLQLKRTFFRVRDSFPYDFINLDFCDRYYPEPPDMMRVNKTVERFLQWQNHSSTDGSETSVNEFIIAVTCRHDEKLPEAAKARLIALIKENCKSGLYSAQVHASRNHKNIENWADADPEDLFFSGWPKDIARAAKDNGWGMDIEDYVYYGRVGDSGKQYLMTCLVARFSRGNAAGKYLQVAFHALDKEKRLIIPEILVTSQDGKDLLDNLQGIVQLRNEQAKRVERPELPFG